MKYIILLCSIFLIASCSHSSDVNINSQDVDTKSAQSSTNTVSSGASTFKSQEVSNDTSVRSGNPSTRP